MLEIEYIRREIEAQLPGREGLIGAILQGSISAGMADATSDYDIQLIFADDALISHPEYRDLNLTLNLKCDLWVSSLSELRLTERTGYDAREYLHALFPIDVGGQCASALQEIIHYPKSELSGIIASRLDGYYDGLFRSLKCFRHAFSFGGHLMASRELEYLVEVLWAINGLIPPFLNRAPFLLHTLHALPLPVDELRAFLERIAQDADIHAQIALFGRVSAHLGTLGYGQVLADWEGVLEHEIELHQSQST